MTDTTMKLEPRTTEALQDLIGVNIDSAQGLESAAEAVDNKDIAALFREIASERRKHADRLSSEVKIEGETPRRIGSFRAQMHRWWVQFRGLVQDGDAHAILVEAERCEDRIKHEYERVLIETAGSAVNDVLQEQHAAVKRRHDLVRDMRDARASSD